LFAFLFHLFPFSAALEELYIDFENLEKSKNISDTPMPSFLLPIS
jgi:hypothetical protein